MMQSWAGPNMQLKMTTFQNVEEKLNGYDVREDLYQNYKFVAPGVGVPTKG